VNKPETTAAALSLFPSPAGAAHAVRTPWFRRREAPAGRLPRLTEARLKQGGAAAWPRRRRSLPAVALVLSCATGLLPVTLTASSAAAQEAPLPAVAVAQKPGVNINTATAEELATALSGVGASKAEAIVRYRTQFGPFGSIEELAEVQGIGTATIERNRSLLRLED
jgi:competence protein ComEA